MIFSLYLSITIGIDPVETNEAWLITAGIDKCNTKIMIYTIRDPDLFRVEN
jgi:hypothetical protein